MAWLASVNPARYVSAEVSMIPSSCLSSSHSTCIWGCFHINMLSIMRADPLDIKCEYSTYFKCLRDQLTTFLSLHLLPPSPLPAGHDNILFCLKTCFHTPNYNLSGQFSNLCWWDPLTRYGRHSWSPDSYLWQHHSPLLFSSSNSLATHHLQALRGHHQSDIPPLPPEAPHQEHQYLLSAQIHPQKSLHLPNLHLQKLQLVYLEGFERLQGSKTCEN